MTDAPQSEAIDAAVRNVQGWMALDLHMALGHTFDPKAEHQGYRSWGDWWAELCGEARRHARKGASYRAAVPEPADLEKFLADLDRDTTP